MHTHSFDHGFGDLGGSNFGGFDSVREFRRRVRWGLGRLSQRKIPSEVSDATTIVATTRRLRIGQTRTRDMASPATLKQITKFDLVLSRFKSRSGLLVAIASLVFSFKGGSRGVA